MLKRLPADTFLNVNVPDLPEEPAPSLHCHASGAKQYDGMIVDKIDPRGRNYYWIGSVDIKFNDIDGTDYHAVARGHISVLRFILI